MHVAAKQIVAHHGGEFPATFDEVLALPGVGRYTAGAILSIGRDERLPILEANTIRVYARLLADGGDVYSPAGQERLWRFAERILPTEKVGQFNQALMELGAMLCTPREPKCLVCPLATLCPTCREGRQSSIPAPKPKKQYEERSEAAVIIRRRDGRMLLRRCPEGERWAGLWDFPRVTLASGKRQLPDSPIALITAIEHAIARLTGVTISLGEELATLKHGVTRFRITLRCLAASYESGRAHQKDGWRWVRVAELANLPLCTTGRHICRLLAAPLP
jgi:A/G-specific adenine glycosylase